MGKTKATQSELDGVQYRRAKLWQIILYACNGLVGMGVYSLIGLATYSASVGYGIATVTVGVILMATRILDAVTDPILAFVYDRVNTRFGKLHILMITGYLIEAVGLLCMFHFTSSKGFGIPILFVDGKEFASASGEHIFTFEVPITGEHSIEARSGRYSSVILIRKTIEPDPSYRMANRKEVVNWFDSEPVNPDFFSVEDTLEILRQNPQAGAIVNQMMERGHPTAGMWQMRSKTIRHSST